jgi:hypothetical protein
MDPGQNHPGQDEESVDTEVAAMEQAGEAAQGKIRVEIDVVGEHPGCEQGAAAGQICEFRFG